MELSTPGKLTWNSPTPGKFQRLSMEGWAGYLSSPLGPKPAQSASRGEDQKLEGRAKHSPFDPRPEEVITTPEVGIAKQVHHMSAVEVKKGAETKIKPYCGPSCPTVIRKSHQCTQRIRSLRPAPPLTLSDLCLIQTKRCTWGPCTFPRVSL